MVGTANFQQMIEDPRARQALANTFIFALMKVPLTMVTALALYCCFGLGGPLVSSGPFSILPVMTPAVAVGILFLLLFNGDFGIVNRALALVGIDGPNWTTDGMDQTRTGPDVAVGTPAARSSSTWRH